MLSIEEIERKHWDCLVVGTGVGGATLGAALARAGRSVLFVEKGRAGFDRADALRGTYPELLVLPHGSASGRDAVLLSRAGRCYEEVVDGHRRFVPFIGCGTGGSSALYGMALERFFPADFEPRQNFPAAASSLPDAWPIRYADLAPYYQRAETLYRVRGSSDRLRPERLDLLPPAPLSPLNAKLHAHFERQGLHPYQLPLACESVPGCKCCQGYLCARECKNDAARICLEPAVRNDGATLLDECEAVRVEGTGNRVTGVACRWQGRQVTFRADRVVLAAGALMTSALMLRSTSAEWPQGLANASGLVGRNLMRHCVDLYLVFLEGGGENPWKQVGLSDFYQFDGAKLGTVQSFGLLPPAPVLAANLVNEVRDAAPRVSPLIGLVEPVLRAVLSGALNRGVLLATIMEDLPYADNRVVPGPPLGIHYRLRPHELTRVKDFRAHIAKALRPLRFLILRQSDKNSMLAHACGTCRFGHDPATSVLDPHNRAHSFGNLYVVDSSFFPSSGGTNPALTIAANALRVADHMLAGGS